MNTFLLTMSETDNSEILADIKALDEALAVKTDEESVYSPSDSSSDTDYSNYSDEDDYIISNQEINESENAYKLNKKLIKGLMMTKKKLTAMLQDCEEKIASLDEQMKTYGSSVDSKLFVTTIGMPYFKDKDYFSAPKNSDVKLKEARGELFLLNLTKPCRWSGKDRKMLLISIHNEAFGSVLSGNFNKEIEQGPSYYDETTRDTKSKKNNNNKAKKIVVLPRNLNEILGEVGKREFDWFKIAATDFENKHSPGECRAMWNIYLHPDIKKSEWTNAEDKKLLQYAKEYKYQDWDTITAQLNTKRSAYQCFIRYNTIKEMPFSGRIWSKQEDKHLLLVLNRLKIGNYIPWSEVASYLQHRTKQQVYTRWVYRKAPHLRKGRFTDAETDTLMQAVKKYGTNFRKIAKNVMPHRTSIQLNSHYHTLIESKSGNAWTIHEDKKLINLHRKCGNDWSKISTYFSSKSRTQVRHRHAALLKFIMKGQSLESIPRARSLRVTKNVAIPSKFERCVKHTPYIIRVSDILLRLYEILCCPLSMRNTNSQEPYKFKQLTRNTKKLYNILNMLNANIDIPDDFYSYAHLNRREKQLLISVKKYINAINNRVSDNELIEEFRSRMFGAIPEITEESHFIPPVPFGGNVNKRNKEKPGVNCDLNFNKKFVVDWPIEIATPHEISYFLTNAEEIQFQKFSKFFINDSRNHEIQNINSNSPTYTERNTVNQDSNEEMYVNEDSNEEICKSENLIPPNYGTLFGLKNLLLWKLLYEYQNKSSLTSQSMQPEEIENSEYQRACQMLKTRLLRLFKLSIGLSNTMLQIRGPDEIFLTKEQDEQKDTWTKRKSTDVKPVELNKKMKNNNVRADNCQPNTNPKKTTDQSIVTNSKKTICKKSKIKK